MLHYSYTLSGKASAAVGNKYISDILAPGWDEMHNENSKENSKPRKKTNKYLTLLYDGSDISFYTFVAQSDDHARKKLEESLFLVDNPYFILISAEDFEHFLDANPSVQYQHLIDYNSIDGLSMGMGDSLWLLGSIMLAEQLSEIAGAFVFGVGIPIIISILYFLYHFWALPQEQGYSLQKKQMDELRYKTGSLIFKMLCSAAGSLAGFYIAIEIAQVFLLMGADGGLTLAAHGVIALGIGFGTALFWTLSTAVTDYTRDGKLKSFFTYAQVFLTAFAGGVSWYVCSVAVPKWIAQGFVIVTSILLGLVCNFLITTSIGLIVGVHQNKMKTILGTTVQRIKEVCLVLAKIINPPKPEDGDEAKIKQPRIITYLYKKTVPPEKTMKENLALPTPALNVASFP